LELRKLLRTLFIVVVCLFPVCEISVWASTKSIELHKLLPNVQNCTACHPDPHQDRAGKDCANCHGVDTWDKISTEFIHSGEFPVTGNHKTVSCIECHINDQYRGTSRDCQSCHWIRKQDDPYKTRLGIDCARCHSPKGWAPANWNHTIETGFKLSGTHRAIACDECHKDLEFKQANAECSSCHSDEYFSAKDPDHKAGGFPMDCQLCHDSDSWNNSSYNHNSTGFSLTGGHADLACAACHKNGVYTGLSSDCYFCHSEEYEKTADPNHQAARFSTDCIQCHDTNTWTSGQFNHDSTGYNLTGAHVSVSCSECHENNIYKGTPRECSGCHTDDYNNTSKPDHSATGYSYDCAFCHDTNSWQNGSFSHTGFDLTGAHADLDCTACHANGQYTGTPTSCFDCHHDDYYASQNPNHVAAGLSTDCRSCHDTSAWENGSFNHTATGYILTGAHTILDCNDCHVNNLYKGLPRECFACHEADFRNATDPDHTGFPTDCAQ